MASGLTSGQTTLSQCDSTWEGFIGETKGKREKKKKGEEGVKVRKGLLLFKL